MARERMSNVDAAWLRMDRSTNLMIVNALMLFNEQVDWARVRKLLDERMVQLYPRFRQRVVGSHLPFSTPYWEDDPTFDLDAHIKHQTLAAPGDQAELQDLLSQLFSEPLSRVRPLWRVYFIDGYGQGCAYFIRIHHCIADGIALGRVMLSVCDEETEVAWPPIREEGERPRRPSPWAATTSALSTARDLTGVMWHRGAGLFFHPSRVVDIAQVGRGAGGALAKLLLSSPEAKTVLTGRNRVAKRVVWSPPIPLPQVKAVGRAAGATVNDVLITALTGALHCYLADHESLVDEIRVLVPFNLRPLDQPLPAKLGNRFGLLLLSLPVGIKDRAERLAEVRRRTEALKRSPEGSVTFGVLTALGVTPDQLERSMVDLLASKASAVVTNVPGPQHVLYMAGTPAERAMFWVPCSGDIGLGVAIFSYNGSVTVGVSSDANTIPDPEEFTKAFCDEVDAMLPG